MGPTLYDAAYGRVDPAWFSSLASAAGPAAVETIATAGGPVVAAFGTQAPARPVKAAPVEGEWIVRLSATARRTFRASPMQQPTSAPRAPVSKSTVVGIDDTGIDWTHPDFAFNVWTNPGEVPGNGIDDDRNGFTDDIHGYDFVNNDGNPMDDHSHGTQGLAGKTVTGGRLHAEKVVRAAQQCISPPSITGRVFEDLGGDAARDAADPLLRGIAVYVDADADGNGIQGQGEPAALTTGGGSFAISGLAAGTYTVRSVAPAGWNAAGSGTVNLSIDDFQTTTSSIVVVGQTQKIVDLDVAVAMITASHDFRGFARQGSGAAGRSQP